MSASTSAPVLTCPPFAWAPGSGTQKALWEALKETSSKAASIGVARNGERYVMLQRGMAWRDADGKPASELHVMDAFNDLVLPKQVTLMRVVILYAGGEGMASAMRRFIGLCQSYGQEVCTGAFVQCMRVCTLTQKYAPCRADFELADMTPKQFKIADEHLNTNQTGVMVSLTITRDDVAMAMPEVNRRMYVEKRAQVMLADFHAFVERYFDDLSDDAKEAHGRLSKRPRMDVKIKQEAP